MMLDVKDVVVRYGVAGKTTTLRMLSGLHAPSSGTVVFEGKNVTTTKAYEFSSLGISHVPEGRRIFPQMTIEENLEMGGFNRKGSLSEDIERMYDIFPILRERRKQLGGNLSGGEQQMLAIGRALMAKPRLLLLDEPSMGLAPMIVETIFQIISDIRDGGTTVLLVEQNAAQALRLADRGYVMENGRIVIADTAESLLRDERVREVYLGESL
jgi:branched-chain amino acid transport system ATP-binding protein